MSSKKLWRSHRLSLQQGAVAIETALLLPIVVILMFAIIHYSMIFFAAALFNNAAKEGLRQAVSVVVSEECYFNPDAPGCGDDEVLRIAENIIQEEAGIIIQSVTQGSGSNMGTLFGVALPSRDQMISVKKISGGGGCCEVTVALDNYHAQPFLPISIIDNLLPVERSVFPEQISATANLKIN